MPLTEFQVKNAKPSDKPHKLADGGGLYLLIQPSGSKLWWLKCRCAAKENVLAFGAYPLVGIADTCTAREEAKKLLATGTDPALKRHEEKVAIVPVVAPPSTMKRRVLAVVDTVSRSVPAPDPRHSYCGEDVVQTLKRVCRQVGCQENPCRSGAKFLSRDLGLCAYAEGMTVDFSWQGSPQTTPLSKHSAAALERSA